MVLLTVNSNEQDLKKTDSRNPPEHNETGLYFIMVTKTELNSFQAIFACTHKKEGKVSQCLGSLLLRTTRHNHPQCSNSVPASSTEKDIQSRQVMAQRFPESEERQATK